MHELVIATSTYFGKYQHVEDRGYRRKLWYWFVESFLASDFAGHKIILSVTDDASPAGTDICDFPLDIIRRYRTENVGYNTNIIENLNMVSGLAPLCLTVDSDAYFHPDWLKWLFSAIEKYPEVGGWSLFNSPRHNSKVAEPEPGIIEKSTSCLHGFCYRTADRPVVSNADYVEHFIPQIKEKRGNFIAPKVSMIQHTGCYGFNNLPKCSQDYDPLFPLNDKCGLAGYTDRTGFEDVKFEEDLCSGSSSNS